MNRHHFSVIKIAFTGLLAWMLLSSVFARADALRLALVLSEASGAYLEYGYALGAELANKNITLTVIDTDKPLPDSELFIAAGMKAAAMVAKSRPAALLVVLVPKEGYGKLLNEFSGQAKAPASIYSAIYLDQPFKRQLDLVAALLPQASSIGLLYGTPPREIGNLRTLAAARKFDLNERAIGTASGLHAMLLEVLVSSDVLLALPDAEVYNASTIRNILLATYRNKVPLIGFSAAYVKAGALSAVYTTPEQFAEQSVALIQRYADTRTLPPPQYAREFTVSVNEQVARSLGLDIKSAIQLRAEIGATP